ncbi:hypothetical protein [Croceiramulus getboli]|nr:hypothetical protein P8624_12240 [Flavobacteriaceae bacterium YJPT1-3]
MRVLDSTLKNQILQEHQLDFGDFYFFDNYVVAEIYDGELFDWERAQIVIDLATTFYGADAKINYISNRIYNYSIIPQDWIKFYKNRYQLKSFSVVTYSQSGLINMIFERMFCRAKIRQFESLMDAVKHVYVLDQKLTINILPENQGIQLPQAL